MAIFTETRSARRAMETFGYLGVTTQFASEVVNQ